MSQYDLSGRCALVTGGARGLGAGMARGPRRRRCPRDDRRRAQGRRRADRGRAGGRRVRRARRHRATRAGRAPSRTRSASSAGSTSSSTTPASRSPSSSSTPTRTQVRAMLEVNVLGTMLGLKHGLPRHAPGRRRGQRRHDHQHRVGGGDHRVPGDRGLLGHQVGVDRLTRVAAMESGKLGYGVRVNCVYPGLVPTDMGVKLAVETSGLGPVREPRRRRRRGRRAHPVRAARRGVRHRRRRRLPRLRRRPASSTASACRSTAGWACEPCTASYLDKGASLGRDAPCLTLDGKSLSYGEVRRPLPRRRPGAGPLRACGPGDKVAILSGNDAHAFACVFGIARRGAVWCPINPRNTAAENRELLALFDCVALIYSPGLRRGRRRPRPADGGLPRRPGRLARRRVGLRRRAARRHGDDRRDGRHDRAAQGRDAHRPQHRDDDRAHADGLPVRATGRSTSRMAPLTHAAGVLCFPVMAMGGEVVIMAKPDLTAFLALVERHRRHAHVPAAHADLHAARARDGSPRRTSRRCSASGTARPRCRRRGSNRRSTAIGPVMAQLFGQSEAPMMISMMPPAEHFRPDGSIATERLASAGRPAPLVTLGIMADDGTVLPPAASGARSPCAARWSWPGTTRTRRPPPRRRSTAGTTPATSATSTRTATCSSSTAPRT